jgi:hypothetical protein
VKIAAMRNRSIGSTVALGAVSVLAACTTHAAGSPALSGTAASRSVITRQVTSPSTAPSPTPTLANPTGSPAELACARSTQGQVDAPLSMYGEWAGATLKFAAGSPPPHSVLCGTFTQRNSPDQQGTATSTPGHLGYLFSLINQYTANGAGGGYYWIAGAVDDTVESVVLVFPDDNAFTTRVHLVPLTTGWRGFADAYSPGPVLSMSSAPVTANVIALDTKGRTVDARHINLNTGAVRQIKPLPAPTQQTH